MVRTIALVFVAFIGVLAGAGALLAQTARQSPMQHAQMGGHDMGSPHEMDVHHSFGNAEQWAKEFDDPSRDAWQKLRVQCASPLEISIASRDECY